MRLLESRGQTESRCNDTDDQAHWGPDLKKGDLCTLTPPGASYGSLLLMRNERLRDGVQLGPTRPCYSRFLAGRGPELLGVGAAAQSIRAPTPIPSPALASCFSSFAPWRTGTFLGVRDRSRSPAPAAGTVCINLPHAQPPLAEPAAGRGRG